ncbi:MAG: DUF2007 domain-containing protein [Guyparkeria sp.]|uniref:putative signal transducing protein n=1 Tax=Guyparkeria sp. TaxID=2035736 RepID=UPI00397E04DC
MKTIYKAGDVLEAHIVCGMLNAEGIEAQVAGQYQQGAVGGLAPRDFARVQLLDERDEPRALELIRDYEGRDDAPMPGPGGGDAESEESGRLGLWLLIGAVVVFLVSWWTLSR